MKRTILSILLIFTMLFSITGCSSDKGTPPVLSVDGMELTLGECTPSSFSSQDFEIGVPGGGVPLGEMPGNSWLSSFLTARKNGESYAYLYVYNPGKEDVYYLGATIYKVTFTMNSEEADYWTTSNIVFNGINLYGMDSAAVKEAMSEYKLNSEGDSGSLYYVDGKYNYSISFDNNGLVEEVNIEMDIPKSY